MMDIVQCRKCGADLDPKQKVCPRCGERTAAGGKFDVDEEPKWQPSRKLVLTISGLVILVILVLVLCSALRVVPPEKVAEEWFICLASRSLAKASSYTTPALKERLRTRMFDLQTLSDEYYTEIVTNEATYKVHAARYVTSTKAQISIILTYPGGAPGPEIKLELIKRGRKWLVDNVL